MSTSDPGYAFAPTCIMPWRASGRLRRPGRGSTKETTLQRFHAVDRRHLYPKDVHLSEVHIHHHRGPVSSNGTARDIWSISTSPVRRPALQPAGHKGAIGLPGPSIPPTILDKERSRLTRWSSSRTISSASTCETTMLGRSMPRPVHCTPGDDPRRHPAPRKMSERDDPRPEPARRVTGQPAGAS